MQRFITAAVEDVQDTTLLTNHVNELELQGYGIEYETILPSGEYFVRLKSAQKQPKGGVIITDKFPQLYITRVDDTVSVNIVIPGMGFKGGIHDFKEDEVTDPKAWANMLYDNLSTAMKICHLNNKDIIDAVEHMLNEDYSSVAYPIVNELDWQAGGFPY